MIADDLKLVLWLAEYAKRECRPVNTARYEEAIANVTRWAKEQGVLTD